MEEAHSLEAPSSDVMAGHSVLDSDISRGAGRALISSWRVWQSSTAWGRRWQKEIQERVGVEVAGRQVREVISG